MRTWEYGPASDGKGFEIYVGVWQYGIVYEEQDAEFIVDSCNEKEQREHLEPPQPGDLLYDIYAEQKENMRKAMIAAVSKIRLSDHSPMSEAGKAVLRDLGEPYAPDA